MATGLPARDPARGLPTRPPVAAESTVCLALLQGIFTPLYFAFYMLSPRRECSTLLHPAAPLAF